MTYAEGIRRGFEWLMANDPRVFTIGQGLWSPWYVGASMTDLDKKFGKERVIDTPVSELGTTAAAVGAAIMGYRPIVIHPRMDFMVLGTDPIINQAAKWSYLFAGRSTAPITVRGIINRGGEQGAQHSQSLHSWYAHIPGLRVLMPATADDARDLLIWGTLSDDPVLYIDDRWLYEQTGVVSEVDPDVKLSDVGPKLRREGGDITLVGAGWTVKLALEAAEILAGEGIEAEIVDLRQINPIDHTLAAQSVSRTGRLVAIDGSWSNCGLSAEILAGAVERVAPANWKAAPRRITLAEAPAPAARSLEAVYYPDADGVAEAARELIHG
ncbi:alpha-ketoacid dehydrogenase subunit beta [Roseovarius spongiae]|uniref:Alpha-ketoacid dehydrogenase subunit beta n=2 Tax=Roseovarius spongiae TaxID=2320272 RepID=A0A3A8B3P0_9RHOB|nr:alpha-ketoacid dehydrogenase subunit beta [Roseovarius spongiae]